MPEIWGSKRSKVETRQVAEVSKKRRDIKQQAKAFTSTFLS